MAKWKAAYGNSSMPGPVAESYDEEIPLAKGRRCYSVNGFSLHANTATKTHQRDHLEKLIRYIAGVEICGENAAERILGADRNDCYAAENGRRTARANG